MNIRLIIILLLMFIGIFTKPFSYGLWDFLFKFIVFIATTFLIYKNFIPNSEEAEQEDLEENVTSSKIPVDIDDEENEILNLNELINEDETIQNYIKSQFLVMASILIPDQGWIVYKINEYKLKVVYQISFADSKLVNIPDLIDLTGIYKIIDDREDLLIENNIQNANYSFQCYTEVDYHVCSFLGIPLNISEKDKLFFLFDSASSGQFNKEDTEIINKIVSGIQSAIKFRLKSISLLSVLHFKDKLLNFSKQMNMCNTISSSFEVLADFVSTEFEADRLTICSTIPDSSKAVIRKAIGQQDIFKEGFEFDLEEGLTGWVIGKNKPYIIEDLEKGEYFIPRYTKEEKSNYGLRSFIGIPFSDSDIVFGALTLESIQNDKYSSFEKKYLAEIIKIFTTIYLRKNINKKEN